MQPERDDKMSLAGVLIPVNGEPVRIDIEPDENGSTLSSLQALVGGYVEPFDVVFGDDITLYVNEDGLSTCAPNRAIYATKGMEEVGYLSQMDYSTVVREGDLYGILFGDIVAVGFDPETGDNRSLTADEMTQVEEYFTKTSANGSGLVEVLSIQAALHEKSSGLEAEAKQTQDTWGRTLVISGPSGVGKTTVARALCELDPIFEMAVTSTTRPMRPTETDGVDYHFLSEEEFTTRQKTGGFIESVAARGAHYGLTKAELERIWGDARIPVLVLDPAGRDAVREEHDRTYSVCLTAPKSVREERLRARGDTNIGERDDDDWAILTDYGYDVRILTSDRTAGEVAELIRTDPMLWSELGLNPVDERASLDDMAKESREAAGALGGDSERDDVLPPTR